MLIEFIDPDFEFTDERGTLVQLVHQGWNQVNFISSNAGVLRGQHYHKNNREAFFVIDGEFKLSVTDMASGEKEEHVIKTGQFFIIRPHLNHSFEFIRPTALIALYDKGVEEAGGEKDIYSS